MKTELLPAIPSTTPDLPMMWSPLTTADSSDILGVSGMAIDWKTPSALFHKLNNEFHFTLDVCARAWSAQCKRFYTIKDDGLIQQWKGVCWCNPPFDVTKGKWIEKAWKSAQYGTTVVVLLSLNATEDTEWWHRYALRSSELRYIRGRPQFTAENGKTVALRCVLLVFRPYCQGFPAVMSIDKNGARYA